MLDAFFFCENQNKIKFLPFVILAFLKIARLTSNEPFRTPTCNQFFQYIDKIKTIN